MEFGADVSSVAYASCQSTTFSARVTFLFLAAWHFRDGTVSGRYVDQGAMRTDGTALCVRRRTVRPIVHRGSGWNRTGRGSIEWTRARCSSARFEDVRPVCLFVLGPLPYFSMAAGWSECSGTWFCDVPHFAMSAGRLGCSGHLVFDVRRSV